MRKLRNIVTGLCLAAATVLIPVSPAHAVSPGTPAQVAFIRGGNLFVADPAGTIWQATTDGGYDWPRWQPGPGEGLAIIKDTNLFYGYFSPVSHTFVSTQQITFDGHVGAGAWSPDGAKLAYAYGLTNYAPTIYIADFGPGGAAAAKASITKVDTHLSPAAQQRAKGLVKTPKSAAAAAVVPSWNALRGSLAIAWSPNGQWIAYPNGECWAIFDDCLSVLEVSTGAEWWVAAFGGGGEGFNGYATVPAFTADSSRVMWTQQTAPRYEPDPQPSHLKIMSGPSTSFGPLTQVGVDGEYAGVPSPANDGTVLVTAGRNGKAWVVRRNGTTRTFLYQGYEHDWQAG